jgi:hypothetical protein
MIGAMAEWFVIGEGTGLIAAKTSPNNGFGRMQPAVPQCLGTMVNASTQTFLILAVWR